MPRSRSWSLESMIRSASAFFLSSVPDCCSKQSTNVVLPWSTWAMMAILRSAFMIKSVSGQIICVRAGGVYTSAANSVQSGAAQLATFRCISLKAERSRAALLPLAKKGPSTKSPLAASAQGALHQGLNIKVRPSGAEQPSGERLFGCLNDRSSHFVGISVRRGPSVLQPSYPAVCMRRHRNADRSPSV